MLADGKTMEQIPNVTKFKDGARHVEMNAVLLTPDPITKANLKDVLDATWITKDALCKDVKAGTVDVCG